MTTTQEIIWPWATTRWESCCDRLAAQITTLTGLDSAMSSIHGPALKPRYVSQLLEKYFAASPQITEADFIDKLVPFLQKVSQ